MPLLAVVDMVDKNHTVVFDSGGSYAVHKTTGRVTNFTRKPKSWETGFELEAPEMANRVACDFLAALRQEESKKSQPQVQASIVKLGGELQPLVGGEPPQQQGFHAAGWFLQP